MWCHTSEVVFWKNYDSSKLSSFNLFFFFTVNTGFFVRLFFCLFLVLWAIHMGSLLLPQRGLEGNRLPQHISQTWWSSDQRAQNTSSTLCRLLMMLWKLESCIIDNYYISKVLQNLMLSNIHLFYLCWWNTVLHAKWMQ